MWEKILSSSAKKKFNYTIMAFRPEPWAKKKKIKLQRDWALMINVCCGCHYADEFLLKSSIISIINPDKRCRVCSGGPTRTFIQSMRGVCVCVTSSVFICLLFLITHRARRGGSSWSPRSRCRRRRGRWRRTCSPCLPCRSRRGWTAWRVSSCGRGCLRTHGKE